jgi:hypothetical protein
MVMEVRKVRLFVTNFFFQKLTPSNVGKIGKKGKIVTKKIFCKVDTW